MLEAECVVEHMQVMSHCVAAERIYDPDGDTLPIEALAVQWPEVVRVLHRSRVETAPTDRGALRVGRRCVARRDELEVTHRRVEGHNGGAGVGRTADPGARGQAK